MYTCGEKWELFQNLPLRYLIWCRYGFDKLLAKALVDIRVIQNVKNGNSQRAHGGLDASSYDADGLVLKSFHSDLGLGNI